jgi:hypothetical protein
MTIASTPTPAAPAPTEVAPEALDAAIDSVFGPAEDGTGAELEAEAAPAKPAPAKVKAKPAPAEAPRGTEVGAEEVAADGEAAEEEGAEVVDELDYDALVKVAEERAGKREAKSGTEVKLRELETTNAELQRKTAEAQQAVDVVTRLRTMAKDDPIALLEAIGVKGDGLVSFLQNGHKQAINRAGFHQAKTLEQLQAENAQLKAEFAELKTGVPQQLEQAAVSQVHARNQREFVALTEASEAFPFLALEAPANRIAHAREAAEALAAAGHQNVTHELVAKVAEGRLRKEFTRKQALLKGSSTGDLPDSEVVAQEGGGAAARRPQVNGSARRGAPRTITSQHASSPPDYRSMSEAERQSAADREIKTIFFNADA